MKMLYYLSTVVFLLLCVSCDQADNILNSTGSSNLSTLKKNIRKSVHDSIAKADSAKVIIATTKIGKKTKVILYDNHRWEYKTTESISKIKNPKPISKSQIRSLMQPTPPVKSEYSPNGRCGALTKKGGSCQRRVKGDGRCYQH